MSCIFVGKYCVFMCNMNFSLNFNDIMYKNITVKILMFHISYMSFLYHAIELSIKTSLSSHAHTVDIKIWQRVHFHFIL